MSDFPEFILKNSIQNLNSLLRSFFPSFSFSSVLKEVLIGLFEFLQKFFFKDSFSCLFLCMISKTPIQNNQQIHVQAFRFCGYFMLKIAFNFKFFFRGFSHLKSLQLYKSLKTFSKFIYFVILFVLQFQIPIFLSLELSDHFSSPSEVKNCFQKE